MYPTTFHARPLDHRRCSAGEGMESMRCGLIFGAAVGFEILLCTTLLPSWFGIENALASQRTHPPKGLQNTTSERLDVFNAIVSVSHFPSVSQEAGGVVNIRLVSDFETGKPKGDRLFPGYDSACSK